MSNWNEDQEWEREWHGNCVNSLNEELKQLVYAKRLGLRMEHDGKTPYSFDLRRVSVLDIGGGPYSLLLKCHNFTKALVADPCAYPDWVYERYKAMGINFVMVPGEELPDLGIYDEVWIYNVLQHTMDPGKIISNARKLGKMIRVFEWIENGISVGHPQNLTEKDMNEWLGGYGKVEHLNESGCVGLGYYGIFKGDHFNG